MTSPSSLAVSSSAASTSSASFLPAGAFPASSSPQAFLTIAVAGSAEFQIGFELAGIKRFYTLDELTPEEVFATLQRAMQDQDVGIIVVEEERLTGIQLVDRMLLENSVKPAIVTLRKEAGESGLLRRQIIRAIGIDLLARDAHARVGA